MERRDARRRHAGGVHPADRPRRAPRHRRRGPRGRASGSRASTRPRSPGSPRPAPTRCGRSFRPSYNMAVNLVGQVGRHRARELLETSFAQFQADRAVVGLARQVRTQRGGARRATREAMTCHLGDFDGVRGAAPRALGPRGRAGPRAAPPTARGRSRRVAGGAAARRRHPGARPAAAPGSRSCSTRAPTAGREGPRPTVLTAERQVRRLSLVDFPAPGRGAATGCGSRKTFNAAQPAARGATSRRRCAPTAPHRRTAGGQRRGRARRPPTTPRSPGCGRAMRAHPCHGCAEREDHARWAERYWRLRRETDAARAPGRAAGRTRSRAPSTGSARCSTSSATSTATR